MSDRVSDVGAAIGRTVHGLIRDRSIPQQQVYEAMGLSRSSLSKKMRGEVRWSVEDMLTVARVLGVPPADLLPPVEVSDE